MKNCKLFLSPTAALAMGTAFASPAWAQAAAGTVSAATAAEVPSADTPADDGHALGDIVVTAQRRSESLQKVPIAISAFDSTALNNAGVIDTQKLAQVSPSMVINNSGGVFATFIRGVGTRIATPGLDPSVATYVDDRYQGAANAALVQMLDIQRVEVVKGPQGVLFGRNATGGAVRLITNVPVDKFEGNVRVSYGNYEAVELRGTINVPLSNTLFARFSGLYVNRDGYSKNINPTGLRRLDDANFYALRGKLRWEPAPELTAQLTVDYTHQRDTQGQAFVPLPPFELNPLLAAGALAGTRPGLVATALTAPGWMEEPSGEFRVDADLGAVKLSSMTTYARQLTHAVSDIDATSAVSNDVPDYYVLHDVWTQEFQAVSDSASRLRWLVGAYFLKETGEIQISLLVPTPGSLGGLQQVKTTSYAGFGQLTYDLTDTLSVILGGRYGYEKKVLLETATPGVTNFVNTALLPLSDKVEFSKFTPRAVLQWQYSPAGMVYASYSRGIKGGGFTFPAVGQSALRPEILDSYELGWKADLLDRRVRLSAAAFYYDYTDLQVNRSAALPNGAFVVVTQNAATSTVKGIEMDLKVKPVDSLTLSGGLTYLDAKYDKYPATARIFKVDTATPGNGLGTVAIPFNADGRQMLYAPKFAGYVTMEYAAPVGGGGRINASTTLSYKSSYEMDFVASPRTAALRQDGYAQLSARLAYETGDPGLSIAIFANNIANKRYLADASIGSTGIKGIYSPPRTYGVQVGYSF